MTLGQPIGVIEAMKAAQAKRFMARGRTTVKDSRGMNKTEAKYAAYLDKLVLAKTVHSWTFGSVRRKLHTRITYTPDFEVIYTQGTIVYVDVKATWKVKGIKKVNGQLVPTVAWKPHWEDDAIAKIKLAAKLFPAFCWFGAWLVDGVWKHEEFMP